MHRSGSDLDLIRPCPVVAYLIVILVVVLDNLSRGLQSGSVIGRLLMTPNCVLLTAEMKSKTGRCVTIN